MSDYIPDDLLADILRRLPLKPLLLFRCVSKSWRDLIDRSVEEINSLVIAQIGKKEFYAFDLVVNKGQGLFMANAKQLIISPPTTLFSAGFCIKASCNGLLLLCLGGLAAGEIWVTKHVLCNPFTCTYFDLPSWPDDFTDDVHPTSLALGYDHINDDYKLVVWFIEDNCFNDRISHRRHELCVYSLKKKSWRPITDGIPFKLPKDHFLASGCTMLNGSAHWLDYSDNFIVAFDLATYEFRKMLFCHLDRVDHRFKTTSCLNGCLSLVCYPEINSRYEEYGVADIWVMEEYGVESSWKKITSIDMPEKWDGEIVEPRPVAILGKGKKLLLNVLSKKLGTYDIEKKSFSKVAVKGETDWLRRFCYCGEKGCPGSSC